jgi:hypothetical protein
MTRISTTPFANEGSWLSAPELAAEDEALPVGEDNEPNKSVEPRGYVQYGFLRSLMQLP